MTVLPDTAHRSTSARPDRPGRPPLEGSWTIVGRASKVGFIAGNLGGAMKVSGVFHQVDGWLSVDQDRVDGSLEIKADTVDTGNRLRDRHLRGRGFLSARRHPNLCFELRSLTIADDKGGVRVEGELSTAGTRTQVALDATVSRVGDGALELACRETLDRYALGVRGAPGMVARDLELELTLVLRRSDG